MTSHDAPATHAIPPTGPAGPAESAHAARPAGPPARRRAWRWALAIVALAGLATFVAGYVRTSTGPASGDGYSGTLPQLPADKASFRVGTLNMHSGVGEDDVFNLGRTIEAVRDTDFCALNEVRGRLTGQPRNQAQELAEATGRAWIYLPSERRFWHDDFGNALITRLPVGAWVRTPLPTEPKHGGLRNATVVRVRFANRTVQILLTHIDRSRDQSNQIRMITRLYDALSEPSLLLGDLNADSTNADVQQLLAGPGVHDCIAEATGHARDRIDWILARGLRTRAGGEIRNGASDHPMYWVDVELNP